MAQRANSQNQFTIEPQSRVLKTYSVTDSEIENMASLGQLESVFGNLTSIFLGTFLGNIVAVSADRTNFIAWVVFWASMVLTITFGIITGILMSRRKRIKDEVTGHK